MFSVTATIPVGRLPHDVAIGSNGRAYVPNADDNTLTVIDTESEAVVATVTFGPQDYDVDAVAVHPNGTRAYVAVRSGKVAVLDTGTNAVTSTITVAQRYLNLGLNPGGNRLYVTGVLDDEGTGSVSAIDTASGAVLTSVPVGRYPNWPVVSPDGSRVFVPSVLDQNVTVIDAATNATLATFAFPGACGHFVFGRDGSRVYATDFTSNVVRVLDAATGSQLTTIPVPGIQAVGIALHPDGGQLYVPHDDGAVSFIDTATNTVTAKIDLGAATSAGYLAMTPDGKSLYVTNTHDDTVTVLTDVVPKYKGKIPKLAAELLGGVASDGGGWLVIGGKFYKIPPRPLVVDAIAKAVAPHVGEPIVNRELGEQIRKLR